MKRPTFCHLPSKADEKLGKKLESLGYHFTTTQVAMRVQFYNAEHPKDMLTLDDDNLDKEALKLLSYENEGKTKRYKDAHPRVRSKTHFFQNIAKKLKELKESMSTENIKDSVELISYLFSSKLDNITAEYNVTREEAANGFPIDSTTSYAGESAIFEEIYEAIQSQIYELELEYNEHPENTELASLITKYYELLNNWNGLLTLAKIKIEQTEGIKLGKVRSSSKLDSLLETELALYEDDNMEEMVKDPAERLKDDRISSYKRIGVITRRLLSKIPVYERVKGEDGEEHYVKDEEGNPIPARNGFGVPKTANPISMHNVLASILINARSKADVIMLLQKAYNNGFLELKFLIDKISVPSDYYKQANNWTAEVYQAAVVADEYLHYLFLDYNLVDQPYAKTSTTKPEGRYPYKENKVINESLNLYKVHYESNLNGYNPLYTETLFSPTGELRENNMALFIKALEHFKENDYKNSKQFNQDVYYLRIIGKCLGIPWMEDSRAIKALLKSHSTFKKQVFTNLERVYVNVIEKKYNAYKSVPTGQINSIRVKNSTGKDVILYMDLYTIKDENHTPYMQRLASALTHALDSVDVNSSHKPSIENKTRTQNSKGENVTLFNFINPGYLSDFFKQLKSRIVIDPSLNTMRQYIDIKFGNNPAFVLSQDKQTSKKKFKIAWLNDLYFGDTESAWSLLNKIEVTRGLGDKDTLKPFENYTKEEYAKLILIDFVQYQRASGNKAKLAKYPVFISGDANQYKTITAPIYTPATILEGLVDFFYMEREYQKQMKSIQEDQKKRGQSQVKYGEGELEGFYLVPEFNNIFKEEIENGTLDELAEQPNKVREKIKQYFGKDKNGEYPDSFNSFKETCAKYGLITTSKDGNIRMCMDISDRNIKPTEVDKFLYEFWLNQKFAMINQMAIMTGSPAFYDGLKDLQKRYKETHSSGKKLDLDVIFDKEKVFKSPYQTTMLFDEVRQNTEDIDPIFMDVIKKIHKDNPSAIDAYKKNKSTDGQAWRTIESYRKVMLGLGKWQENPQNEAFYKALMEIREKHSEVINGKKVIHFDQITDEEILTLSKFDVTFQPLKPFLFTHESYIYNEEKNEEALIPVQIKCSEALLIPELMLKGSRMRDVAEYMTENDIDVAAMTSTTKVGPWGSTDISKANSKEELVEILKGTFVHMYDYRDYIMQVNVPPHEYEQRLFATQIRKLILGGNYDSTFNYFDGEYPTLIGSNGETIHTKELTKEILANFYNELLSANFIDSLKDFLGDIKDKDTIAEELIKSIINNDRESMDSIIGLIIDEKASDFTVPLCEGLQEYTVVSNLIALFKKVVNKQSILGGSAVQATSFGLRGYDESEGLHYVTNVQYKKDSEGFYLRDKKTGKFIPETNPDGSLSYPKDKEGKEQPNVLYAEVEIPLMHKWYSIDSKGNRIEHSIDYDKYCNPDGTLKYDDDQYENFMFEDGHSEMLLKFDAVPLIDKDFPGLRDFIAYRIPTERDYSMINCKAVRFTRPTAGITIRVPSQCVTISGFDFDIDKLYFMFKAFEENEEYSNPKAEDKLVSAIFGGMPRWKEYNMDKTPYENPRVTRDNKIIEIIRQRLMDSNTLKERLTPGGFPTASEAAANIRQLVYNSEAFKGMKEITLQEIEAVRKQYEKDHPDNPDPEPEYNYTDLETLLILNERNQLAAKLIGIFANQNTNHVYCAGLQQLEVNTPICFGKYAEKGLSDLVHSPEGIDTYKTLAELLAASVDAVKDPVLGYLNLNTLTANAACLLGRLGYSFFDIGLLLQQPIIRHVCELAYKNNIPLDYAINNYIADLKNNGKDFDEIDESKPSQSELIDNIINDRAIDSNSQLAILKLFQRIQSTASELNQVVSKTKFTAANAIKPTFGKFFADIQSLQELTKFKHINIRVSENQKEPIVNNKNIPDTEVGIIKYIGSLANNPMAFEQCMFDCMKAAMNKLLEEFPYQTDLYTKVRKHLQTYSKNNFLDDKTIDMIHRELPIFLLFSNSEFDLGSTIKVPEFGNKTLKEYLLSDFPKYFIQLVESSPELKNNPLCKAIILNKNKNKKNSRKYLKLEFNSTVDNRVTTDELIGGWEEMLNSKNSEEIQRAAELLFYYNLALCGTSYGVTSYLRFAPIKLKNRINLGNNTSWLNFWRGLVKGDSYAMLTDFQIAVFTRQFIANHVENNKFVTPIVETTFKELKDLFVKDDDFVDEVVINSNYFEDKPNVFSNIARPVKDSDGQTIGYTFAPALSFTDASHNYKKVYYILSEASMPMEGGVNTAVYTRFEPIGQTNKTLQYGQNFDNLTPIDFEEDTATEEGGSSEETPSNSQHSQPDNPETPATPNPVDNINTIENNLINELVKIKGEIIRKSQRRSTEDSEMKSISTEMHSLGFLNSLDEIVKSLEDYNNMDILNKVESIQKEALKNGVIVMNSEGKYEPGC